MRYICAKKRMFSTYKKVDRENLYIENSLTSKVLDIGKVILKMTFKKLLILINVLYVVDNKNNLVSSSLLSKTGFKMDFRVINLYLLRMVCL
jgi:hypothetical protein